MRKRLLLAVFLLVFAMSFGQTRAFAHCDTLEGPVIQEAKTALETKDVTPVLKWVPQKDEEVVKTAFEKALKERVKGPETKEKADMEFFEALVRIHRESEGAPFTGIKPAGTPPEPAVVAADEAIASGSADALIQEISNVATQGIRTRFNHVLETKKHMNDSVEAGRAYVAAYVDYVHYVEGVHNAVAGASGHHHEEEDDTREDHQHKQ